MKTIRKMELKWSRISLVQEEEVDYKKQVKCAKDTITIINSLIGDSVNEKIIVLHLNSNNTIIGYDEASKGGIASSAIKPADIFRPILLSGATAIVLAHNHPSGNTRPSTEDIKFTQRTKEACELMGIRLLDHIIIGEYGYYSFIDEGVLT